MTKRMTEREARDKFLDLLSVVSDGNEAIVVERKGRPIAVMISADQYERYERQMNQSFRAAVDELRRQNQGEDPETVLRDVTEVVEEVRREQYEREHCAG